EECQLTPDANAHTRAEADAESYRQANASLGQARKQAIKLLDETKPTEAAPSRIVAWLMRVLGIKAAGYSDTNYIFPTYILTYLPRGLAGLVIAVIFAAAMSTLSGEFNSLATATMADFYKRFVRVGGTDAHD